MNAQSLPSTDMPCAVSSLVGAMACNSLSARRLTIASRWMIHPWCYRITSIEKYVITAIYRMTAGLGVDMGENALIGRMQADKAYQSWQASPGNSLSASTKSCLL